MTKIKTILLLAFLSVWFIFPFSACGQQESQKNRSEKPVAGKSKASRQLTTRIVAAPRQDLKKTLRDVKVDFEKAAISEQDDEEKKREQEKKQKEAEEKRKAARQKQLEQEIESLRQYLAKRDIEPTKAGVQKYLQQITDKTRDWSVAKSLIEKLSSSNYADRSAAQKELLKLPEVPIDLLRKAVKSHDREQAFRAKMILRNAIPMRRETVERTFRYIELSRITGLTEEIFRTTDLFQDETSVVNGAKRAMGAVVEEADADFLEAAIDKNSVPVHRNIAIFSLRRLESKRMADSFLKWANEAGAEEAFRLEAILGLADIGDRRALELLLGIMVDAESAPVRARANIALRKMTEQRFKFSAYEKLENRTAKSEDWKKWIAENGATAKLNFPLHSIRLSNSYLNGNTLLAFGYKNKVVEYDEGMNEIWSYNCQGPWAAEKMANGNVLIAEYRKNRVIEVNSDEKIVREFAVNAPLNARPLENGNILVSAYSQRKVLEVNREGKTVWEFTAKSLVPDAVRMENGNTLVCEYQSVAEVNSKGDRIWEITARDITGLGQIMGIQALENGNVLLASMAGYVIEVDKKTKKEVWRHNCNRPSDAFRLENGNTLITEHNRFIEVNREGKTVWSKGDANYGSARR